MATNVSYISTYDGDLTDTQLRAEAVSVTDIPGDNLLGQMLIELKKIQYHLYLGTDTELHDEDV